MFQDFLGVRESSIFDFKQLFDFSEADPALGLDDG